MGGRGVPPLGDARDGLDRGQETRRLRQVVQGAVAPGPCSNEPLVPAILGDHLRQARRGAGDRLLPRPDQFLQMLGLEPDVLPDPRATNPPLPDRLGHPAPRDLEVGGLVHTQEGETAMPPPPDP
jgi:hypothetical protein